MSIWQSEKIQFVNKGLDILSDTIDMEPGFYRKLTNAESIYEGSLSGRRGIKVTTGTTPYTSPIHSMFIMRDAFHGVSTVLVAASTALYSKGNLIDNGFSGNPLTITAYRPEKVNYPVAYIADTAKMRKVFYDDITSAWISQEVGIEPPPYPIAMDLQSISSTTPVTQIRYMIGPSSIMSGFMVSTVPTETISIIKKSQTVAPGEKIDTILRYTASSTAGALQSFEEYFETVDAETGTNENSNVEGFIKIARRTGASPSAIAQLSSIRLIFLLSSTALSTTDPSETYYCDIPIPSEMATVPGTTTTDSGSSDTKEVSRSADYNKDYLSDISLYNAAPPEEPIDGGGDSGSPIDPNTGEPRDPVIITPSSDGWSVFSIKRSSFKTTNFNPGLSWRNVRGLKIEYKFNTPTPVDFTTSVFEITITQKSGLDSYGLPGYQWRHTYWNDRMGIESNPCEEQAGKTHIMGRTVRCSMLPSDDPQVTHANLYRIGGTLASYHLVESVGKMQSYNISKVSTCTPIGIVLSSTPNPALMWGDQVLISGLPANTNANGKWQIIPISTSPGVILSGSVQDQGWSYSSGVYPTMKTYLHTDYKSDQNIIYNHILELDHSQPITSYERRTNLIKASENMNDSNWAGWNIIMVESDIMSPSGGTTFSVKATENEAFFYADVVNVPETGIYTFSFYAKRIVGTGYVEVSLHQAGDIWEKIALPQYPDQRWQRYFITGTYTAAGSHQPGIRLLTKGDIVGVWGFMLEKSDRLKPYLQTFDATVTVMDGTKLAQPLPVIFGPFMGKYIFGLGDPNSPGTLYWCNPQYPDYWSPLNSIEVTQPNEPLVAGGIFDGKVFVFTSKSMYVIYPSMTSASLFQVLPTSVQVGISNSDSIAIGDAIYFASGSGLFATTGGPEVSISDASMIRPIFRQMNADYEYIDFDHPVKLAYLNPYLYVIYTGVPFTGEAGHTNLMVYNTIYKRWTAYSFGTRKTATTYRKEIYKILPDYDRGIALMAMGITGHSGVHEFTKNSFSDTFSWGSTSPVYVSFTTGAMDQGHARIVKKYGDIFMGCDNDIPVFICIVIDEELYLSELTIPPASGKRSIVPVRSYGDMRHSGSDGSTMGRFISMNVNWEQSSTATAIMKYAEISHVPQGEEVVSRHTDWSDLGVPVQKYIWGVNLDIDTFGSSMVMMVYADGQVAREFVIEAAIGRRKVEASWGVFQGSVICLGSDVNSGFMLYDEKWLFHEEAPHINKWHTYWETMEGGEGYLYGLDIEGDTHGVTKEIIVQTDGGTESYRGSILLDGHTIEHVTFAPVKCKTVRLISEDDVDGFLYKTSWRYEREAPSVLVWDTNYENDGSLDDKWISGFYLETDTDGMVKPIEIHIDGLLVHTDTVCAYGRKPAKVSFGPVRGVTMRMYSNKVSGRLYQYRWIWAQEPVQLSNFATNWENLDWPYEKLIKGFSIDADTGGRDKVIVVARNNTDSDVISDEITINHNGRQITMHHIDNALADNVRLIPQDNVPGRLYNLKWVYDREPLSMEMWQTQESPFEVNSYMHLREAYIALKSDAPVLMELIADGHKSCYNIQGTGGEKRKVRVELGPHKALIYKFIFKSGSPFKIYNGDCVVYAKPWNSNVGFKLYQLPFAGGE